MVEGEEPDRPRGVAMPREEGKPAGNAPPLPEIPAPPARRGTGILPCQELESAIEQGWLAADRPIEPDQIQPASLDLRLGARAWRVRASFLPGANATVEEKLANWEMHALDLEDGAVLERNCVYVVALEERVRLPRDFTGLANPKSSTGRLDVFTRLIADRATSFDRAPGGYRGPLYAEIAPRTFSIRVRRGSRLIQLRLKRLAPRMPEKWMRQYHEEHRLIDGASKKAPIHGDRLAVTLDLAPADGVAGFRARRHAGVVDVDLRGHYDPREFWEPIAPEGGAHIVLDPDDFYILAAERVRIPPDLAAEMVAWDTVVGEFRVHYAGFFDPGFGLESENGAKAVLEVRSHNVPFVLEHGQTIGWLRFETLTERPARLYGSAVGSSYQGQGLKLGKQFRAWPTAAP